MSRFKDISAYRHQGAGGAGATAYSLVANGSDTSSIIPAVDTLFATPFILARAVSLSSLTFNVQAGAAGSSARVGIYANTRDTLLYPSSLIVDGMDIATVAMGVKTSAVGPLTLAPGIYWSAYLASVLAPTILGVPAYNLHPLLGNDPATLVVRSFLSLAFPYAALPATFGAGAAYGADVNQSSAPALWGTFA